MSAIDTIILQLVALDFDNDSNDAIYAMIAQGIGEIMDNLEIEFTNTKNDILNTINTQRYGRPGYYKSSALAFQNGDDLVPAVGSLDPTYAVIDPTKQVVKQASFQNNDGSLSIKVAGQDSLTGNLIQLPADQLSAFISYFLNFEIPGLPVSVICLPANVWLFNSICTANAGYNLSNLKVNLQAALIGFLTNFNTVSFDGTLFSDSLSTYIKANVPGVIDFYIFNNLIDGVPFSGSTLLLAGYFNYDATVFPNVKYNLVNA